jgi:2-oxoisovalerate dehydrogenase E1 component
MNAALAGTDPVIFFESQRLYDIGEMFQTAGVPEGYYEIELGLPSVKRSGADLTMVTLGPALYTAVAAADQLAERFDLATEIIDLRSANPIDYGPLAESVRKTGRVLLVSEAVERGGVMQTVASTLTQICFDDLDAPPAVVGSRNWITPAPELETVFFPQPSWLVDAVHEQLLPLPGYRPQGNRTRGELLRRARLGV